MDPETTYLRYVDEAGTIHVVQTLDEVPSALRAKVERFTLKDTAPGVIDRATGALEQVGVVEGKVPTPVLIGVGAGVALLVVALLVWKIAKKLVWLAIVFALAAAGLLGSGYLGGIRKQAGLTKDMGIATPADILRDAREAGDKLREHQQKMQKTLDRIQRDEP